MTDKFVLRRETKDVFGKKKVVKHTFEGETLDEVLENVIYFLNGCSYTYLRDLIMVKDGGQEIPILDYQSE